MGALGSVKGFLATYIIAAIFLGIPIFLMARERRSKIARALTAAAYLIGVVTLYASVFVVGHYWGKIGLIAGIVLGGGVLCLPGSVVASALHSDWAACTTILLSVATYYLLVVVATRVESKA